MLHKKCDPGRGTGSYLNQLWAVDNHKKGKLKKKFIVVKYT